MTAVDSEQTRTPIAFLANLLRPHWPQALLAAGCALITVAGLLALPLACRTLLGEATHGGALPVSLAWCMGLTGGVILLGLSSYTGLRLTFALAYEADAALRKRYLTQLLGLPPVTHYGRSLEELNDRVVACLAEISWFFKYTLITCVGVVVLVIGATIIMFVLSWQLSVLMLVVIPLLGLGLNVLFRRVRRAVRTERQAAGHLSRQIHQLLHAADVVKAFNAEHHEAERFRTRQTALREAQRRAARDEALLEPLIVTVVVAGFVLVLAVGGRLLAAHQLTPGTFIAFLMYVLFLLPQTRVISQHLLRWQQLAAALGELQEILALPQETDRADAVALPSGLRGRIEFQAVRYTYRERHRVLDGLDLMIEPEECVGIVGASGAGKSTLFRLLLRFCEPQSGAVLLDGWATCQVTAHSLRAAIAYVSQDAVLFDDTIMENVRYGRLTASDAEVRAACRAAQADAFIRRLPDQYQCRTGSKGRQLSGGERQRLAIARVLLKDAPVLLLDEPTASLDAQTEHQLSEAMRVARAGRTTVIVAHRLATVVDLDRIVVLHQGRVLASGTHAELLERCAHYRALVATQLIPPPVSQPLSTPLPV